MRAVISQGSGASDVLQIADIPPPKASTGQVLIEVVATAINRADILQRQGHYPPPPGATDVLGLECSGRIVEVGDGVTGWAVGDEVCALLAGGGYAQYVAVPSTHILPRPVGVSLVEAAALPEAACTVWSNLFMLGHLASGQTLLCHGGSGGIGTMAIQIAASRGARVLTTAGSPDRVARCRALGAQMAINHRTDDFVRVVSEATNGIGVDLILDNMGASYFDRNLAALATDGTLVIIGLQGGVRTEVDFTTMMKSRATVACTALRSRTVSDKAAIVGEVSNNVWPMIENKTVRPVIDRVLPIESVREAHQLLESGEVFGKLLLTLE